MLQLLHDSDLPLGEVLPLHVGSFVDVFDSDYLLLGVVVSLENLTVPACPQKLARIHAKTVVDRHQVKVVLGLLHLLLVIYQYYV